MLLPVWLAAGAVLSPLIPSVHAAQFTEIPAPDDGIHSVSVGMTEDVKPGTVSPTRSRVSSLSGQIAVAVSVTALLLGLMLLVRLMAGGKPDPEKSKKGAPGAGPYGPGSQLVEPQPGPRSQRGGPVQQTPAKPVGEPASPSEPTEPPSAVPKPQPENGTRSTPSRGAQQEQDSSDSDASGENPEENYTGGGAGGFGMPEQQQKLERWIPAGAPEGGEWGEGEPFGPGARRRGPRVALNFTSMGPTPQGSPQHSPAGGPSPAPSRSPSPPPGKREESEPLQSPAGPPTPQRPSLGAQYDISSSDDESSEGEPAEPTPPPGPEPKGPLPAAQQRLQRWTASSLLEPPPKKNTLPEDVVGKIDEQQGE